MRKLKLLFLAAALTGSVGMMGQKDVTSTYITNADFEGSYEQKSNLQAGQTENRAFYEPNGWTLAVANVDQYDMTILKDGNLASNNFTGSYLPSSSDKKYMVRFKYYKSNEYLQLSQTKTISVAGIYRLSCDMIREASSKLNVELIANGTSVSNSKDDEWENRSLDFTIAQSTDVTFTVKFSGKSGSGDNHGRGGADNVQLLYTANYTTGLSNAIAYATHVNTSINNSDLTTAIGTAQGVLDAADNTPAYQTTIDNAISTLYSAVSSAVATNIEDGDVTYLLTNPSFEKTDGGVTSTAQALTSGGTYYGWELPSLGTTYVNISIGNSTTCDGQNFGIPNPTDGTYYYFARRGWNSSSSADATLSTPILSTLPAGRYTLTVNYKGVDKYNSGNSNQTSKGSKLTLNAVMSSTLSSVDAAGFTEVNNTTSTAMTGDTNWKTATLVFEVPTPGNVTLNIIHHFVGGVRTDVAIDNLKLEYKDVLTAAKADLLEVINTATAITAAAINVGDNAFQIPTSSKTTLETAIATAQGVYESTTASKDDVESATTTLNDAVTEYFNSELNAPDESDAYSLYLVDGLNKTVTFKTGNATSGGYAIGYTEDAGSFYNQAIYFKHESGNQYKLYITDAAGTKHYLGTGANYSGGNSSQIRMTDNEDKALLVQVIPTETDGVYNLQNTAAGALIGSNGDTGVYTAQTYKNFNINAATKNSVDVKITDAEWATTILPFEASIPTGITAYSVSEVDGDVLTLVKVTTGKFEANTPYILSGEATTKNLQGYGLAKDGSYNVGLLTGVYTDTAAPVSSYVLQNNNDVVGFYQVEEGSQPTVGANRCYLTVPAGSKAAYFFDSEALGINAIDALTAGEAEVYSLNGVRLPSLQKGMNIIKMKNGKTQKVMVK